MTEDLHAQKSKHDTILEGPFQVSGGHPHGTTGSTPTPVLIDFHVSSLAPISRTFARNMRASTAPVGVKRPKAIGNRIAQRAIVLCQKGVTQLTLGLQKREKVCMPVVMGGPGSASLMTEKVGVG
jgi:hypothetical protein